MPLKNPPARCRIVLIVPEEGGGADSVGAALAGGDVASVILPQYGLDEQAFQKRASELCLLVQQAGAAFIIAGDSRVAGRVGADGMHLDSKPADVAAAVQAARGRMIVGAGGAKTRHDALELGEAQPDYLFFGKFGFDTKADPHPRNLSLGQWWAEMVEIPGIVMAGSALESVVTVAATKTEFVAVAGAVFECQSGPEEAVRHANALLDKSAPVFED